VRDISATRRASFPGFARPGDTKNSQGPAWKVSIMECVSCLAELDHCHGTLILHENGAVDCIEPGCPDLDEARHVLRISCVEVDGGCVCTATFVEEFARAS
jgi:hypothetical protein